MPKLRAQDDPEAAKQFLLQSLVEQADRDGVTLSDIEKRMFLFSESSGETYWEANQRFEAECDEAEYEKKVKDLLHKSYIWAKQSPEDVAAWKTALEAVRDVDFYGLVMVDQARIPRPKPRLTAVAKTIARGLLTANPTYLFAQAIIVIAAGFLLLDPWQWGLVRSDLSKLMCVASAGLAFSILHRTEKRSLLKKLSDPAPK